MQNEAVISQIVDSQKREGEHGDSPIQHFEVREQNHQVEDQPDEAREEGYQGNSDRRESEGAEQHRQVREPAEKEYNQT